MSFFKNGSYAEVTLVANVQAVQSFTSKKDGKDYHKLMLMTNEIYKTNNETRNITRSVVVFTENHGNIFAVGNLVAVTGELSLSVVAPASEQVKYPVNQVVVKDAKVEVLAPQSGVDFQGVNQALLIGRVGNTRSIKTAKVEGTSFSLAVSRTKKTEAGYEDQTDWFDCSFFGKRAEYIATHVGKGDIVAVRGVLTTRQVTIAGAQKSVLAFMPTDFNTMYKKPAAAASPQTASSPVMDDDDIAF